LEEEVQRQGKRMNFEGKMKRGGMDRKEKNVCNHQNRRKTVEKETHSEEESEGQRADQSREKYIRNKREKEEGDERRKKALRIKEEEAAAERKRRISNTGDWYREKWQEQQEQDKHHEKLWRKVDEKRALDEKRIQAGHGKNCLQAENTQQNM
jgi:hypothetical protein